MRCRFAAIVFVALPVVAFGQSRAPEPGQGLPLPSIGLPLPTIGIPHRPMGLPAVGQPEADRETSPRGPGRYRRPDDRKPRRHPGYLPVLVWPVPVLVSEPQPESRQALRQSPRHDVGWLRVAVESGADTQVFVDGLYRGLIDDVEDGIELEPGPHALDIRALGYEPHTVTVAITAGRATRYRAALTPEPAVATPTPSAEERATAAPRPTPVTFYEIPGCYLGNVPPTQADLPRGCDLGDVRTTAR